MADHWLKDDLADSRYIWLPITFDGKGKTRDPLARRVDDPVIAELG